MLSLCIACATCLVLCCDCRAQLVNFNIVDELSQIRGDVKMFRVGYLDTVVNMKGERERRKVYRYSVAVDKHRNVLVYNSMTVQDSILYVFNGVGDIITSYWRRSSYLGIAASQQLCRYYYRNGGLAEVRCLDVNSDSALSSALYSRDTQGRLQSIVWKSGDSVLQSLTYAYTGDSLALLYTARTRGGEYRITECHYNLSGYLIFRREGNASSADGADFSESNVYHYSNNDRGDPVDVMRRYWNNSEADTVLYRYRYDRYDRYGNWVERRKFSVGSTMDRRGNIMMMPKRLIGVEYRKITYY